MVQDRVGKHNTETLRPTRGQEPGVLTCRSPSSSLCLAVEADPGRAVPEPKPRRVTPVSRRRQRLHHGAAGQRSCAVRPVHLLHCNPSVSRTQHSRRNVPSTAFHSPQLNNPPPQITQNSLGGNSVLTNNVCSCNTNGHFNLLRFHGET